MVSMRFDFRDIFKAARVAFSFQRLWIQFFGFSIGYLCYIIFTYLSLILSGKDFGVIWSRFGLFPTVAGYPLHWTSWILFGVGCFILFFAWLVTATAVARAAYMHLKGNTFYTWKEAIAFALKKKGGSVVSTPIAILLIAVFTALGGVVVGLLGRIPVVGELGISFFAVIWFLSSLFIVFVILALFVSLLLGPAIIATTDDDAFEGIFQSFSIGVYIRKIRKRHNKHIITFYNFCIIKHVYFLLYFKLIFACFKIVINNPFGISLFP